MRAYVVAFVAALAAACGDDAARRDESVVSLLDPSAFQQVDADEDPLATHRPAQVECPEGAYVEEDGALEIQTGYCNYAALAQPLPIELRAGDRVHLVLLHEQLVSDELAEAHVALLLGEDVIWETSVAIPSEPEVFDETFDVPSSAQPGEPLMLHLHNHGYNSWKLLVLERVP